MDENSIVKVIEKWKGFWMNQTQNSEADYLNYLQRALGVDANMKYHLADLIWKDVGPLVEELKLKNENGCCIVEHGYRIAAEHKVEALEARVAELIRWHEKKDRHVEQLEGFVISVAPSWLPEGIRAHRRELIKRMGLESVVADG